MAPETPNEPLPEDAQSELGRISVDSIMWFWWYARVRRYRVVGERTRPERGLFGGITYRRTWTLEPPSA